MKIPNYAQARLGLRNRQTVGEARVQCLVGEQRSACPIAYSQLWLL